MKKIALIFCILFSISGYSQTDYRKGYIINKSGKKINGYVNYKENSSAYLVCEFKSTEFGKVTYYSPNQIKGYGFHPYKLYLVKSLLNENMFFEIILKGKVTLLKHLSTYYVEKGELFKKLDNDIVEYKTEYNEYKRKSKKYIGVLKLILNDCKPQKSKYQKLTYSERSFIKLIKEYNECGGEKSFVYKEQKPQFKSAFGIAIGLNYATLHYNHFFGDGFYFTNKTESSTFIVAGGFTELSSPRISERYSFYTGLFYMNYNFITNKIDTQNNSLYEVLTKINQLKVPLGIRYTFPEKKLTPYFTLGASNFFNINSSTFWSRDFNVNNIIHITRNNYQANTYALGYFGSIGVKKRINKKFTGFIDILFENFSIPNTLNKNNKQTFYNYSDSVLKYNESIFSLQLLAGIRF
jgi:hypothetical protein